MSESQAAFHFHRCLGEGGYGEVYLATQETQGGIKRDVAVKVLRQAFDEESDAFKRLRDEGQALALLQHPVIVSVHQFCEIDGRLALVMEYVEGADASWFCHPDRPLPTRVVVEIIRETAEALHHAMTADNPMTGRPLGMIHRDIKPANIRLTVDGKLKLLDFGVARSSEMKRHAKTMMGEVMLTPGFGSPEALGYGVSGPEGDVFSLGVSFYQLLTCEPFYGDTDFQFQVSLALDSEDFKEYLRNRLELIRNERIRELVGSMLTFQHELRPKVGDIADACDDIWRSMDGPQLSKWARTVQFPDLSYDTAELCGKVLDGRGVVIGELAPSASAFSQRGPAPPSVPPAAPQFGNSRTLGVTGAPPERTERPSPSPPAPPSSGGSMLPLLVGVVVLLGGGGLLVGAVVLGIALFFVAGG